MTRELTLKHHKQAAAGDQILLSLLGQCGVRKGNKYNRGVIKYYSYQI